MEKKMEKTNRNEIIEIDLIRLIKALWSKLWVLILAAVLCGAGAFAFASYGIAPKYSSSIMLYVNNSSFSVGSTNFSISSSELSAAQSLTNTYIVILRNRTTLEKVIEDVGVDYTYKELLDMTTAASVNNTEVFKITVTSTDAVEAKKLAASMAKILTERVSDIIDGSSMRVVDNAAVENQKVSPSITKYTAMGIFVGLLISALVIVVIELCDDVIHDEDYLFNTFEIPVLTKIPDLNDEHTKKYGYYSGDAKKDNEAVFYSAVKSSKNEKIPQDFFGIEYDPDFENPDNGSDKNNGDSGK